MARVARQNMRTPPRMAVSEESNWLRTLMGANVGKWVHGVNGLFCSPGSAGWGRCHRVVARTQTWYWNAQCWDTITNRDGLKHIERGWALLCFHDVARTQDSTRRGRCESFAIWCGFLASYQCRLERRRSCCERKSEDESKSIAFGQAFCRIGTAAPFTWGKCTNYNHLPRILRCTPLVT